MKILDIDALRDKKTATVFYIINTANQIGKKKIVGITRFSVPTINKVLSILEARKLIQFFDGSYNPHINLKDAENMEEIISIITRIIPDEEREMLRGMI